MAETIVVAGSLAQKPKHGGHAWVLLQYLLGFRRLGWDVLFLDRLEPDMCVNHEGRQCPLERSSNLHSFLKIMEGFDPRGSFAIAYQQGDRFVGLSRQQVLALTTRSAFLLNVMGYFTDEEILACAPRRVFLDIDPGFGQMWHALGLADLFQGYDDHVTIAERIGQPDCAIPTCGLEWITTRQPVVLDYWPAQNGASSDRFSSIASWRGAYGPVNYQGKTYGLRVHEFRRFAALPQLSPHRFELALDIHPSETEDLSLLAANGWSLVDPKVSAGDPWTYRAYIQNSKAEFMAAKNMYVQTRSGWFSDRSICYLASGRPVLVQDTGLQGSYPVGEGLMIFTTVEEAREGVEALSGNYAHHARAARRIAQDCFDSDHVLGRLLGKLAVA